MDEFLTVVDNSFDTFETVDDLKFGIYLTLIILIFLLYLNLLLSAFNIFLRKTRNLVGMLPLEFFMENNEKVKKMVAKVS